MGQQKRRIGWGIVSTGNIARTVAGEVNLLEDSVISAVSSRSIDSAQDFASTFDAARSYDSVRQLVEDDSVDVVYVATPHPQHAAAVRLAAAAGKAVLCEKAFTHSLAETQALVREVREAGVFCMEAMWTRFNPLIVTLRSMVADGVIGEIRSVSADLGFVAPADPSHRLWDPFLGGGALLDVGIYPVAFAQMVLGRPSSVVATGVRNTDGIDAEAGVLLSWPDGARAHLEASLTTPQPGAATVIGTRGRIEVQPRFHHPERMIHVDAPNRGQQQTTVLEKPAEGRGYVPMLRAVADAVRDGRTECAEMPLSDTVEVMTILDTALDQLGVGYPQVAAAGGI